MLKITARIVPLSRRIHVNNAGKIQLKIETGTIKMRGGTD